MTEKKSVWVSVYKENIKSDAVGYCRVVVFSPEKQYWNELMKVSEFVQEREPAKVECSIGGTGEISCKYWTNGDESRIEYKDCKDDVIYQLAMDCLKPDIQ